MKRNSISLCLLILFSSQPVFTQQSSPVQGEVYAIVVGISKYNYIRPLSYADRDADLFTELLRSGAGGRIKQENLFLMKNDSANAGNFWSAISRISNKQLKKGDRVFIYFAGHGDAVKGLNEYYLLLSDCQAANDGNNYMLSLGAIDMYHLKNRIGVLTARGAEVILILDACRTNELAGGYASQVFNSSIIQTKVGEITMLATGPGQISIEDASFGNGHGLFTYNLVDAFSGKADREEIGNNDKSLSLEEIKLWVTKNVKLGSDKFRVSQSPVFCCDEKNKMTIGVVDSIFSTTWNKLNQINNQGSAFPIPASKNQRGTEFVADTSLIMLYNKFNESRKANNLWGDNSANSYYDQMETKFKGEQITEDARYMLASDFINFAQKKINLYLEGKDLLSVESMREKNDSANTQSFLSDEYERMQTAVSEKWTITAMMIQKAGKLLSTKNDSTLFYQLKPRIGFLLARGYIGREKENDLQYDDALKYALEAYSVDSTAAYAAECVGLIYAYRHNFNRRIGIPLEYEMGSIVRLSDTSMRYFRKAIALAPKWVSPYRSIALKIYGHLWADSAYVYLRKALLLNPDDGTTYMMIGDLYRQRYPDSALYYLKKALELSGRSSHAMIYRKMARTFLETGFIRNSPFFKPDSVLKYSNLALAAAPGKTNDASKEAELIRTVYMDIAAAYTFQEKYAEAMPYYFKVIALYPENEIANRAIVRYYSNSNVQDSGLYYAQQFLRASPGNAFALLQIAQHYENKKGFRDSAILYYEKTLEVTKEKDMPRERLSYLLMDKNKTDTRPLDYFTQTMNEFPAGWRSYYNIACYYSNRGETDKAFEFLEKAFGKGFRNYKQVNEDRYLDPIRDSEAFKRLMAKHFPK
ncbi:MAG TPA: caspase family protein [Chitinophagaceae bacterium]|nr:caspase family protein [Chitinophagaceae bacterium]